MIANQNRKSRSPILNQENENIKNIKNTENLNQILWKSFAQKIKINHQRKNLKKEFDRLQKLIKRAEQIKKSKSVNKDSQSNSPNSELNDNSSTNQQLLNENKVSIQSIEISKSSKLFNSKKNSNQIQKSPINDKSRKQVFQIMWNSLSQHLRRSTQRMDLIHMARNISFQKRWKYLLSKILTQNSMNQLQILKSDLSKVILYVINQIFQKNKFPPVDNSIITSTQFFDQLKMIDVKTALLNALSEYYSNDSTSKSIAFTENIPISHSILSKKKMFQLVYEILSSLFTIRDNDIDDYTAEEIVQNDDFEDVINLFHGDTAELLQKLLRLERKDMRLDVNDRIVSNIVQQFFDGINYPIVSNDIDPNTLNAIMSGLTVDDALIDVSRPNIDSIATITQKDLQIYVNNQVIEKIIEDHIEKDLVLPIVPNTVDDDTAYEIVENDSFDDVIKPEFAVPYINDNDDRSSLVKLLNYSESDIRSYFSDDFVDNIICDLFGQVINEMPICPNTPSNDAINEIIEKEVQFLNEQEDKKDLVFSWIDPILRFEEKDVKIYASDPITDFYADKLYSEIENQLPLEANDVTQDDLDQITSDIVNDAVDTCNLFKSSPPSSILNYQSKGIQLFVNDNVVSDILGGIFESVEFPIEPNEATQKDIDEILEDDFNDITEIFSNAKDWIYFLNNLDPHNMTIKLDDNVLNDTIVNVICRTIDEMPIVPNTADDKTIDEILNTDEFNNFDNSLKPKITTRPLSVYEPIDTKFYINETFIENMMNNVFNEIEFPIVPNTVDDSIINQILNTNIEDSLLTLPFDFSQPIQNYKPKDIQVFVNDQIVDDIMDNIFDSFELPLTDNVLRDIDIDEILQSEEYEDVIPPIPEFHISESIKFLEDCYDPDNRKINFNFPLTASMLAREAVEELPLCPNTFDDNDLNEMLSVLDKGLEFHELTKNKNGIPLSLDAHKPLKRFMAPDEVYTSIDDCVEQILNKMLAEDIFPSMPVEQQAYIDSNTANSIIQGVDEIDYPTFFNDFLSHSAPQLNVGHLKDFSIPELPYAVSPDDVLNKILYNEILEKLPIIQRKKRLIGFRDVVDEIILDNYIVSSKSTENESNGDNTLTNPNEMLKELLTDPSESDEIDQNVPYLMITPSNSSSPTQMSANNGMTLLDTSSESLIEENHPILNASNSFDEFDEKIAEIDRKTQENDSILDGLIDDYLGDEDENENVVHFKLLNGDSAEIEEEEEDI